MKTYKCIILLLTAALLPLVGCSSKGGVDTAPLEQNFKAAESALKSSADKAIAAIKSADYAGAMTELQNLASNAKLTPEQQQAVKDVIAQVQKALSDMADKAKGEATKAVDDAKKALPK